MNTTNRFIHFIDKVLDRFAVFLDVKQSNKKLDGPTLIIGKKHDGNGILIN
jgi:hypothetical protein